MLVTSIRTLGSWRRWFTAARVGLALLAAAMLLIAPYLGSGTELVRLRNALSLGPDLSPAEDWSPPNVPADYLQDTAPPDPYFRCRGRPAGPERSAGRLAPGPWRSAGTCCPARPS